MERCQVLKLLAEYPNHCWPSSGLYDAAARAHDCEQSEVLAAFVRDTPGCLHRQQLDGHVTGSALVIDPRSQKVLLTLHAKLHKWLQLGGHADGDPDIAAVAMREVAEESGLSCFDQVVCADGQPWLFDVDIHHIPSHADVPAHQHYDMRFLVFADENFPLVISQESKDLAWMSWQKAFEVCDEWSMRRQLIKARGVIAAGLKDLRLQNCLAADFLGEAQMTSPVPQAPSPLRQEGSV